MSCRNRCCNRHEEWDNNNRSGSERRNRENEERSACRRDGCFTATVPVTVRYTIMPDRFDERAIISQIPGFEEAADEWCDPPCGCQR